MTQAQIERKLAPHSEDILSVYELIERMRDELMGRLNAHDARFDRIDGRLAAHDARFDRIDGRLAAHDARFDHIDETLAEVLRRLPA